jgi:hypothetical protein
MRVMLRWLRCVMLALRRHLGDDRWSLRCDGHEVRSYVTDDLRLAIVYRARCFASASEKERFARMSESMTLRGVLGVFRAELAARGRLSSADADVEPLALAMLIINEFVRFGLCVGACLSSLLARKGIRCHRPRCCPSITARSRNCSRGQSP